MNIAKDTCFKLNCNWVSDGFSEDGKKSGSWNGEIAKIDDGFVIGMATDEGSKNPTHVLVGVIIDGALSICKLNVNDAEKTPIWFDVFEKRAEEKDTLYGTFTSETAGGTLPLGDASILLTAIPKVREAEIHNDYKSEELKLFRTGFEFPLSIIRRLSNGETEDIKTILGDYKQYFFNGEVPETLKPKAKT